MAAYIPLLSESSGNFGLQPMVFEAAVKKIGGYLHSCNFFSKPTPKVIQQKLLDK